MKKIATLCWSFVLLLLLNLIIPAANAASMSNDIIGIRQTLEQFVTGWNKHDPSILESTWDLNYDRTTYIPVESSEIVRGGKNIAQYYQSAIPYVASVKLSDLIIDVIGNSAQVVGKTDFEINNEDGSTYSEPLRVNFTLKKSGDRWPTIHYAESATVK